MAQDMVYAIYPFKAEREDELDLEYGEAIIVLEKDDMYGDGWWMGQNMIGNIGLFPMNYTSYNKPRNKLDNKDFRNKFPIVTRSGSYKIDHVVDSKDQNSNLNNTIKELQNELQIMIDNNNNYSNSNIISNDNNNNNNRTRDALPSRSRLSTPSSNTSSYYSPRNSQYQASKINNVNNINDNIKNHPLSWNVHQVCQWLSEKGFNSETKNFIENNITGDILFGLNSVTIKELNVKSFGRRAQILNAISLLKEQYSINDIIDDDDDLDDLDKAISKAHSKSQSNVKTNESNHTYSITGVTLSNSSKDTSVKNQKITNRKGVINPNTSVNNRNNRQTNDRKSEDTTDDNIKINPDTFIYNKKLNDRKRVINPDTFNNQKINDQKNDINSSNNFNAHAHFPPSKKSEKPRPPPPEKPKIRKKPSLKFFNLFTKSNNTKSENTKSDNTKSNNMKPNTKAKSDMSDSLRSNKEKASRTRSFFPRIRDPTKNNGTREMKSISVYDEFLSYSNDNEISSSKLSLGRRKNASHDNGSLIGNQFTLPKKSLSNESLSSRRTNSYYSEHNVDYINENTEGSKINNNDHEGILKKQGERYRNWKSRLCVLKGTILYYYKSERKSKIKGRIELTGYRIIPDENIYQGKYGFKLLHETEHPHFFAHEDLNVIKSWMRAILKATIDINMTVPITTSNHIRTVPLSEARKMANRMPRLVPSLPNLSANNSTFSTFSGLPSRPAPSPPLSSLPKPKAPPTGELPPRPKSSNLSLNSNTSSPPSSPSPIPPYAKHLAMHNQNSTTKTPKFPSMSLSILNTSRTSILNY